jgi:hypothetical protein
MVEEVGELELRDELPKGKPQESGGVKNEWENVCKIQDGGKDALATLIWSPGLGQYKEEGSPDRGVVSLRKEPS